MRAIVLQRQRIDHAAAGECQPGLPRQERDRFRARQAQSLRRARSAARPPAVRDVVGTRPGHRRCGPPASRPRSSAPARTARVSRSARPSACAAASCSFRAAPRRPGPPKRHAAASRGTKTRVNSAPPASAPSVPASSRPRVSRRAGQPDPWRRSRDRTPAPASPRHPRWSVPVDTETTGPDRATASPPNRLTRLGAADVQRVPAGRDPPELMIKRDDPVHFRAAEVQRCGDQRLRLQWNAAEYLLQPVQDRHRRAIQTCQFRDYGSRPKLVPWLVAGQRSLLTMTSYRPSRLIWNADGLVAAAPATNRIPTDPAVQGRSSLSLGMTLSRRTTPQQQDRSGTSNPDRYKKITAAGAAEPQPAFRQRRGPHCSVSLARPLLGCHGAPGPVLLVRTTPFRMRQQQPRPAQTQDAATGLTLIAHALTVGRKAGHFRRRRGRRNMQPDR